MQGKELMPSNSTYVRFLTVLLSIISIYLKLQLWQWSGIFHQWLRKVSKNSVGKVSKIHLLDFSLTSATCKRRKILFFLFPHVFMSYPDHLSLISRLFFIMIEEKCLGEASQVYLSGRFAADGFLHDTFWTRWQTDAELLKWDVAWCEWMCSGRLSFKEKRSVH